MSAKRLNRLLQSCLLFQPCVEVFLRHDLEVCLHVVVTQSAELGAQDLVPSDLGGREMYRKVETRDEVLLDALLAHEE